MDFLMGLGVDTSAGDRAFLAGLQVEARRIVSTAAPRPATAAAVPVDQQDAPRADGELAVLAMSARGGRWSSGHASTGGLVGAGPRLGWRR